MFTNLERYERYAPLLWRIGIGLTMFLSGYGKVTGLDRVTQFFESIGIPMPGLMAHLVGYVELIGGVAMLLGFGTRAVALLFAFIMLVAIVSVRIIPAGIAGLDFNEFRLELLMLLGSLGLVFTGSGALSLDEGVTRRQPDRT